MFNYIYMHVYVETNQRGEGLELRMAEKHSFGVGS
jgi:hypothetical protein